METTGFVYTANNQDGEGALSQAGGAARPDTPGGPWAGAGAPLWGAGRDTRKPRAAAHGAGPGSSPHPGRPRGGRGAPSATPGLQQHPAVPGRPRRAPRLSRPRAPPPPFPARPPQTWGRPPGAQLLPETWRCLRREGEGRGGRGGATRFSLPRQSGAAAAAEGRAGAGAAPSAPRARRPRTAGPRASRRAAAAAWRSRGGGRCRRARRRGGGVSRRTLPGTEGGGAAFLAGPPRPGRVSLSAGPGRCRGGCRERRGLASPERTRRRGQGRTGAGGGDPTCIN